MEVFDKRTEKIWGCSNRVLERFFRFCVLAVWIIVKSNHWVVRIHLHLKVDVHITTKKPLICNCICSSGSLESGWMW